MTSAATPPPARLYMFAGGATGPWCVESQRAVIGEPLPAASRLTVGAATSADHETSAWLLRGITSHDRYVVRAEKTVLAERQQGLGRPDALCAALIPIRKSAAWWALTQDERREVFEERSQHIRIGLQALPAVSRRLHHCRDLGWDEPFDFLTWFEYAPDDAPAFDELVQALRATPEWSYVEREVDLRLRHDSR